MPPFPNTMSVSRWFFCTVSLWVMIGSCSPDKTRPVTENTNAPTPLSAEVKPYNGKPTIFVNNQPVFPIIYSITDSPGGRWTWEEMPNWNIRNFAKIGFKLFQVDIWLETIWSPDGKLDMALVQKQLRGVLDIAPDAGIQLRLHVNSPRWWNKQFPEECTAYVDTTVVPENATGMYRQVQGDLKPYPRHSMASERWKRESGAKLAEFCQQLASLPEGNALVALHLCSGVYHEWHYWAFFEHFPDSSQPMTRAFGQWLRRKYRTEQALQQAWNDPKLTFASVTVPGKEERLTSGEGVFRIPNRERKVIDYVQAQHEILSDALLHFCKIAKENWPRPLLTGAFYGYMFTMFGRQAAGGHLQMQKVLDSPYIDYLSAPDSYQSYCREIGGTGQSRGVVESLRLHNKLWIGEMDRLTTIDRDAENTFIKNLPDDIATIRRNVAQSYTRGVGLWFFDFGPKYVTGWWDAPEYLNEIKRIKEILDRYHQKPFVEPADVLLVLDTDCFYYTGYDFRSDPVSPVAIDELSADLYHSGVTLDMVYLSDLEKVNLKPYKAVVFANTTYLSDKQRVFIRNTVAKDGRHLVWNYMPGYTNGDSLNTEFIADVTGIQVSKISLPAKPQITTTGTMPKATFGINAPVQPLVAVTDKQVKPLGNFAGSRHVAFATKQLPESTVWFSSLPLRNPAVWREVFRQAGAHIYGDQGDVIYNGGGILCIHTLSGGNRVITLKNRKMVAVQLAPRATVYLDSETGEVLLQ